MLSTGRRRGLSVSSMATARVAVIALLGVIPVCLPSAASADDGDEANLAERYAPVVRLVAQAQECGYGEAYLPIDVDALFDEPTVALRGPWGSDLVKIAPSAQDLTAARYEYNLDFPGNPLDPGCDYERWAQRVTQGTLPTVYAHVATDPGAPGKLALQYWLFYVFNDWNNTHEGDWEMIQLNFDANTARQALMVSPISVGYSQHEGAERAAWGDDKLEVVDGTHPVVHPAAGSHANFFEEALYLGRSASEGVGCDDATGPTFDIRPAVRTIPSDPTAAGKAFPWIRFAGRWGERQRAFFNGPTGPNLKERWTEPIQWSDSWRDRSVAVPGAGALASEATDFFCGAVAAGSNGVRRSVDHPLPGVLLLAGVVVLLGFALSRTTWRPATPLRLARRRAWGQILAAAANMYGKRLPLFLGIGLLAIPISVIVTVLQSGFLQASSILGIDAEGERGGILVLGVLAIGTALTLLSLGLVQAATARALVEIDAGRNVSPVHAYRLALDCVRPLVCALVIAAVVVSLLLTTVFLVPIAIWLTVVWALIVPVVELEGGSTIGVLRRSARLVRHAWLKVGSIVVVGAALALFTGPFFGALLILLTSAPLWLLNLISGLVYAVMLPFVALTTAYLYFDRRVWNELARERTGDPLPAEIEFWPGTR
jgi:multisubunit Na+/H+ antiporter MnhC subunit